jgi:hypothetical protein
MQPGVTGSNTVALVGGEPVGWSDLSPLVAEAAGGAVLEEVAIDRQLVRELRALGIEITGDDLLAERRLLLENLGHQASMNENEVAQTIERVRTSRGLGPRRFNALLWRNAGLRKLVIHESNLDATPDEVRQAIAVRFGERARVRIITVDSERQASEIRSRLISAEGSEVLGARFIEEASRQSTDVSAARGGLIESMSLSDPAFPAVLRELAGRMSAGEVSPVIALERGFALILLIDKVHSEAPPAGEEDLARHQLRVRKQRIAMESLARDLVRRAAVIVTDESLRWSWSKRAIDRR